MINRQDEVGKYLAQCAREEVQNFLAGLTPNAAEGLRFENEVLRQLVKDQEHRLKLVHDRSCALGDELNTRVTELKAAQELTSYQKNLLRELRAKYVELQQAALKVCRLMGVPDSGD